MLCTELQVFRITLLILTPCEIQYDVRLRSKLRHRPKYIYVWVLSSAFVLIVRMYNAVISVCVCVCVLTASCWQWVITNGYVHIIVEYGSYMGFSWQPELQTPHWIWHFHFSSRPYVIKNIKYLCSMTVKDQIGIHDFYLLYLPWE